MGILGRFFGRSDEHKDRDQMSRERAVAIIQHYGAILEHDSPAPGCVADVGRLTYTKAQIKEALIIGLRATTDPQMRSFLQVGYLQLADWQEGVGDSDVGLDLTNVDPDTDVKKLAKSIAGQSGASEKWSPIVSAEQGILKRELIELGFWDAQ
jgi:hypothetical protein